MTLRASALRRFQSILHQRPTRLLSARKIHGHRFTFTQTHSAWPLQWLDLRPILYALQLGLLLHFFTSHIGFVARTIGPSMVPTISPSGECVYISRLHKRGRDVKVGDLVDFEHPLVPGMGAIKRVIGMPGDFVIRDPPAGAGEIVMGEGGLVSRVVVEALHGDNGKEKMMLQVPEGHCWVLGDNLPESRDSRTYGPLPLGLIKGKVTAKVWPLREARWIENTLQPLVDGR